MSYRKFRADLLFTGTALLDNNAVLITDATGKVIEIIQPEEAGEDIETFDGLLSPGFVNAHCHVELSHMKGRIPEGTGLEKFLVKVIRERFSSGEIIEDAIYNAVKELHGNGTVAVADICNTTHSIAAKTTSNIAWHNFIEVTGFTDKPQDRFAFAVNTLREFDIAGQQITDGDLSPRFDASLAPHAPYSVSEQLFKLINAASANVVTIHNQEAASENEWYRNKKGNMCELYEALNIDTAFFQPSGKSSLQTYLPLLDQSSKIILVHNCFTSTDDLQFVKYLEATTGQQFYFANCVNANLYIQSALPPLLLLKESGCKICLGTDSYASNHSLSMLEEMKSVQHHFPSITLADMLTWSTINGAKALAIDKLAGSFEKEKRPGIVHVSGIKDRKLTAGSVARRVL